MIAYRSSLALRACLLALSLATYGCAGSSPIAISSYSSGYVSGQSATLVSDLSKTISDSASFDIYFDVLNAPYSRAFRAAVTVLNAQGDTVQQADSDGGYIVTARMQHGFILSHHDLYVVAFESISDMRTKMTFKLFSWTDLDAETPGYLRLVPQSHDLVARRALRFVDAVRAVFK